MKQECIQYAQKVGMLGDPIRETGIKFDELSKASVQKLNSLKDIQKLKQGYINLLGEFKNQEIKLNAISAPEYLKDEHSELLSCFKRFVNSTELAIQAFDPVKGEVDTDLLQRGLSEQRRASKEIVIVTNKMVEKINKL